MDSKVDVLAVMTSDATCAGFARLKGGDCNAEDLMRQSAAAREAIAELIAADREYDAARQELFDAEMGTPDAMRAQNRVDAAKKRRAAALQRITGDNNGH